MIRVHHVDHDTAVKTLQTLLTLLPPVDPAHHPITNPKPETLLDKLVSEWLSICREHGSYSIRLPDECTPFFRLVRAV